MYCYYTLMKALLAVIFITLLAWTKVVIPKSTTNIGLLVNLDNDDNLGVFNLIKILEEDTNSTKEAKAQGESKNENVDSLTPLQLRNKTLVYEETSCRVKRQLASLLNSIPSLLLKNILLLFSNLISAGNEAKEFAKNLIPHTAITNSDALFSIQHHIDNGEGHQIMNVVKAHTRDWDVKEAYPQLHHPNDCGCRYKI